MIRSLLPTLAALSVATPSSGVDLEVFEFNDPTNTPLTAAANSANPGNNWFYDEEATTPGDATTGDISSVQSGSYRIVTDSAFSSGLESRFLDIDNVSSGTIYLTATFSGWNFEAFDGSNTEQVRFTFLDDDSGTSGSTVTAQMQVRRNATTGSMELFGDAIGTAGSFNIANTVDLPDVQTNPFTMVLAVDQDSNSFEVFYKDGTAPSQSLGLGGISRARDANSIRMVTNNFGVGNFPPFVLTEQANLDRLEVSNTNPLTDLITLEVDRVTGAMTLVNTSGASVSGVTGVTLESATGSLDLTDFDDFAGTLGIGQMVSLDSSPGSAPGLWVRNPVEDINASLITSAGDRTLNVDFVGNGGAKWVTGDLDFDGTIDADDYVILTANAESDLSGLTASQAYLLGDLNNDGFNDVVDFGLFKDEFIDANGPAAFDLLVAGIPEPSTIGLTVFGLLGVLARRRVTLARISARQSHTMSSRICKLTAITLGGLLLVAAPRAEAVILEDFQFNDSFGTSYDEAENAVNPGNFLSTDTTPGDLLGVATNGSGQLNASLKNNTNFGTTLVDTDDRDTGKVFGVMELTWDFQSVLDPSENEEIRVTLISSGTSGVLAEWEIQREDDDTLTLLGNTVGGSDIPAVVLNGGSLVQTDKFIGVIEADLDSDTYAVYYSSDAGASFQTLGTGTTDPTRSLDKMRMVLNNDLSDDNVLIDRLYLTDELPFVIDPDLLTLLVHPKSGYAAITNDTGTAFDIDYYRVQSADNSLIEAAWTSLEDQAVDAVDGPDAGGTAGDGVGETWTEAGGSDANVLSESFLLSSSVFAEDDAVSLGGIIDLSGEESLLEFEYRDAASGGVFTGNVVVGELLDGDFNLDGKVDAIDYTVFRDNASGL
ncbi:MAG: PEP-CTERM sorting domain-containing protein, partial [Planctomycetota bacterium]